MKDALLMAGGLIVCGPLAACMNRQRGGSGDGWAESSPDMEKGDGTRNGKLQADDGQAENKKNKESMKILIIESSPHKHGSSNMLADNFAKGAREAGHTVDVFDAGHASIHPCLGCDACGMNGPCVQKDDYEQKLKPLIKSHDMIVLATPLYYYGFSAQMKMVIDRFYSFTFELTGMKKKTVLICAAWNSDEDTYPALRAHYDKLCRYMDFQNQGMILGLGCGTPSMTRSTEWPKKAYELGKSL